jgi:hypothetical protein
MYAQAVAVGEAEEYLASMATRLRGKGVNVETQVWYGPPAAGIIQAAEKLEADLIVISSHGRSGLGRLALGSVAEAVLRGTRTPILLLHVERTDVEAPRGPRPGRGGAASSRAPSSSSSMPTDLVPLVKGERRSCGS